jgi:hypothetical protein
MSKEHIMQGDYRLALSAAEFDAIPMDDEYPINSYYDKLIAGNTEFKDIGDEYPRGYGDIRLIPQLTKGQQLLILLGAFDGQVKNGGITQFFWNYPEYMFEVYDAIEYLGPKELLQNYDKALSSVVGNKDRWLELRQECYQQEGNPRWESFVKTYELLDLEWFDNAYFDKWRYSEKEAVIEKRGLNHALLKRLAEYVRSHRNEFIQE